MAHRAVDNISGFEPIRQAEGERSRGFIARCRGCGRHIIVCHRVAMYCIDCQAERCQQDPARFSRFYRSSQWKQTRTRIFEIKGRQCVYCGMLANCVDHQIPVSRGGNNAFDNLEPVCCACNSKKHDKTHEEFIAKFRASSDACG